MLVAVAIALALALPQQATRFQGRTAQGRAISFSVTSAPQRLVGIALTVSVRCARLGTVVERRRFPLIAVEPDGSFSGVSRGSEPRADLAWVIGRLVTPKRIEGTARLAVRRPRGSCTSLPIAWTATAR